MSETVNAGTPEPGHNAGRRRRDGLRSRLVWGAGWFTLLALSLWLSNLTAIWLWLAAVGSTVWSVGAIRDASRTRGAAAVALWMTVFFAVGVQHRLSRIVNDWPALLLQIERRSEEAVDESLNRLLDQGERAVAEAESAIAPATVMQPRNSLFDRLAEIQRGTGVTAIVVFDSTGSAVAWSGEHRGVIPVEARLGSESYIFHEGPLFSYLYFVRPLSSGLTAAAAFLLEGSIQTEVGDAPFADRFQREHGPRPEFWVPERAPDDAVWEWVTEDQRPIFSLSFLALTQQSWWQRVAGSGRRWTGALGLLALVALSAAWYRSAQGPPGLPALLATVVLLAAPLGAILRPGLLFSPLQFVLPAPLDITLGVLLVLLTGLAIWLLSWKSRSGGQLPTAIAPPLLGAVFAGAIALIERASSDGLLAARAAGGFTLQIATALLIAIPVFVILRSTRVPARLPVDARVFLAFGYASPAVLGLTIAWFWHPGLPIIPLLAAVWLVPAMFLIVAGAGAPARRSTLRAWLSAGWLAGTVTLGFLWPMHVRAELDRAGMELTVLGTRPDPFLDYLLRQFAEQARSLSDGGESGVNLLYHAWMGSGLAREGYEARISLWRDAAPEAELNLSALGSLPRRAVADVLEPRSTAGLLHYGGVGGLHYLLVVPLGDAGKVSVAVPPRRSLATATPLARFLYPESSHAGGRRESLYLVPVDPEAPSVHGNLTVESDTVQWMRTARGWRSEMLVEMPEGPAHAHLLVDMATVPLLLTRAILAQIGILISFLLMWGVGRVLARDRRSVPVINARWFNSFRGRLSAALFAFFLLPTLVFGAVSYGAVAQEVVRSAAALAQQALDQAAVRLPQTSLSDLATTVQTDLLMYRQGTIVAATAPELIDLGLFHTWLPPAVHLRFAGGEELQELEERSVAASDYLVAYRRMNADTVLAAPIPLASNEISRRQQEFRDVAALVVLLGLGLSFVLALFVSRALASPLDELSRAAVTVGGGNLRVRLPETRTDEFGNVYGSFNRMVKRLRRTRAALVKETRRTETIVAEAATGVLALDSDGRIELVNPRAAEILGGDCRAGDRLTPRGEPGAGVAAAIGDLIERAPSEAAREVEVEGRIVRIKLRRLAGENGSGGVVVALEDVTSEVRTARVLAWGEMARQVAHEIKNPLTPIKLAVQHLRRAFVDDRPDFGTILDRNVEAILREIDRLGEISRAFSRFGTPGATLSPLEEVDVQRVIGEVLALYRGSDGGATFRNEGSQLPLPRVTARTGELKEVLVNLLENAREAVGEGGEVVVSTDLLHSEGSVVLGVRDTGVGIPEAELPRIFDPHFSTRSSGTGLGLAIVKRIVESWGGSIAVESRLGQGTRMEVRLPVAAGAAGGEGNPEGPTDQGP